MFEPLFLCLFHCLFVFVFLSFVTLEYYVWLLHFVSVCVNVSLLPHPFCPDLTKLVDCQWKKQPPKTKLSPPSPTANPYLSVMLVNVFRETYFGNESFFLQERITSDLL